MDASQFQITQDYGYDPAYQGNSQHFHFGIDYGAPEGTSIVVNGVVIGLVGHTGKVYDQNGQNTIHAAHLHVGKWLGGVSQNPGRGNGFNFNHAVVTQIDQDVINGKYVRLDADGASWVYLHMSDNSKVSVGQILKGGEQPMTAQEATAVLDAFFGRFTGRKIKQSELDEYVPVLVSGYPDKFFAKAVEFDEVKKNLGSGGVTPTKLDPGLYEVK